MLFRIPHQRPHFPTVEKGRRRPAQFTNQINGVVDISSSVVKRPEKRMRAMRPARHSCPARHVGRFRAADVRAEPEETARVFQHTDRR